MIANDGHILIQGTYKCVRLHGKEAPGYYKQCCDEHWGTRVSFNSGFLGVYAQQWDC